MLQPGDILTLEQVAEILNVKRDHAYRLCASGSLPSINVSVGKGSKSYRVLRDDLEAYVQRQRNETPPQPVKRRRELPPHIRNLTDD